MPTYMVGAPVKLIVCRLVQRVPPIDAELDDRQVDHADQRQDGARPVAAHRIVEGAHQRDVAEIQEEQHQHRGQPRVPHPPGAPHRLAPDAAGGQAQRGEARRRPGRSRRRPDRPADAARPATATSRAPARDSRPRPATPPGTWTYMIRTASPCCQSAGAKNRPQARPIAVSSSAGQRQATAAPRRTAAESVPGWRNGAGSAPGFAHSGAGQRWNVRPRGQPNSCQLPFEGGQRCRYLWGR